MKIDQIGGEKLIFPVLDSTNDYAKELLGNQAVCEGTVIWAHRQLKGRGLAGTTWVSEGGKNLTFSVILHPLFLTPSDQFYLSMIVSLGLTGFLREYTGTVSVKWPNDIYAGNRKIAGILIENSIMDDRIEDSVIGIGININQSEFSSDIPNPLSLKMITGNHHVLSECLNSLCLHIEKWYLLLKQGNKESIKFRYTEQLYLLGKESKFRSGGRSFTARIRGIDNYGRIALERPGGLVSYFSLKEVEFTE